MMNDTIDYTRAMKEIALQPIQGSKGTYHVKNGIIYCGYNPIPIQGFSTSSHFWEIMH